jgi:2-aminoethylphosphonate-pyruvate transaminase
MALIAERLRISHTLLRFAETVRPDPDLIRETLRADPSITHVAVVHCETTTGILNPLSEIADVVQQSRRILVVDAMSSFGGIPMEIGTLGIDFMVSSANKCIQGVTHAVRASQRPLKSFMPKEV